LGITFEVNAIEEASYSIRGLLMDKNGNYIDSCIYNTVIKKGKSSESVSFGSKYINMHGVNGPYELCLIITNTNTGEVLSILKAYTTKPYDFNSFKYSKIILAENHGETVEDTNNNGLYDYLTLSFDITAPVESYYSFKAQLFDKNNNEIEMIETDKQELEEGKQNIVLKFDGEYINKNNEHGPYYLKNLTGYIHYLNEDVPIDVTYTTQEYKWHQFEFVRNVDPVEEITKVGDVDENDAFNSIDFGWLRKYLLGTEDSFPSGNNGLKAADVNGDGSVNSVDFGWMRSKLLGKIDKFPAEK
jgi:hypothetical protein